MRFEDEGVKRQEEAKNVYQANKLFEQSCYLCCMKNVPLTCDRCKIAIKHDLVVNIAFANKRTKEQRG